MNGKEMSGMEPENLEQGPIINSRESMVEKQEWREDLPDAFVEAEKTWHDLTERDKTEFPEESPPHYEIFKEPWQRERLFENTEVLAEEINKKHATDIVLLDKSARPIATLLQTYWPLKFPDKSLPAIRFFNFGREKVEKDENNSDAINKITNDSFHDLIDKDKVEEVDPEILQQAIAPNNLRYYKEIHDIFSPKKGSESYFKNKNILIVDDYEATGASLALTKRIFEIAFGNEIKNLNTTSFASYYRGFSGGMPWSHGASSGAKTEGLTGVIDKPEKTEVISQPIPKEPQWKENKKQSLALRDELKKVILSKYFEDSKDSSEKE